MTPDAFSILAARAGHGVVTYPILDTVQFRFGGKAFATLGWPAAGWAVIKLDPRDQDWALSLSEGLAAEPGGRRRAGVVLARMAAVDEAVIALVLSAAWRHAAQRKSPARALIVTRGGQGLASAASARAAVRCRPAA